MFHPCDELPPNLNVDDSTLINKITSNFTFIRTLGFGAAGVVMELFNNEKKKSIALKVEKFNLDEITIACKLNALQEKGLTSCFGYTHGWAISKTFPKIWLDRMDEDDMEHFDVLIEPEFDEEEFTFLYIAMNVYRYKLFDVPVLDNEIRCILFLLIHALAVARQEFGDFMHNDLHADNIMIEMRDPNDIIRLVLGDEIIEITGLAFLPKIIDYGLAEIKRESTHETDLYYIKHIFVDRYSLSKIPPKVYEMFFKGKYYMNIVNNPTKDYQTLFTLLLEDPFFKIDNIRVVTHESYHKKLKPNNSCISCGSSNPTVMYAKNSNYIFCNIHCEKKYSGLHDYLPSK